MKAVEQAISNNTSISLEDIQFPKKVVTKGRRKTVKGARSLSAFEHAAKKRKEEEKQSKESRQEDGSAVDSSDDSHEEDPTVEKESDEERSLEEEPDNVEVNDSKKRDRERYDIEDLWPRHNYKKMKAM